MNKMSFIFLLLLVSPARAYWLMGINNFLTTQRIDPIVTSGAVANHVHSVLGGSNFAMNTTTKDLRASKCTSIPIPQDKSAYWFPQLYFQWSNQTFTFVEGNAVIYYLFNDTVGATKAFPDDFRMLSGDPNLRTLDPASFAQQAVTHLCLDGDKPTKHSELPRKYCAGGIRSQINFPSCWDGKNTDSEDHRSHIQFLSTGPDSGTCSDPSFPITVPRIFMEVYWQTQFFDAHRGSAFDWRQPFVFSNGDPTGYGFHADFINGWDEGVLQKACDECNCDPFGDASCCVAKGVFSVDSSTKKCFITDTIDEQVKGTLSVLPGANPVQEGCFESYVQESMPGLLAPVFTYDETALTPNGSVISANRGSVVAAAQVWNVSQTATGKCLKHGGARKNFPLSIAAVLSTVVAYLLF